MFVYATYTFTIIRAAVQKPMTRPVWVVLSNWQAPRISSASQVKSRDFQWLHIPSCQSHWWIYNPRSNVKQKDQQCWQCWLHACKTPANVVCLQSLSRHPCEPPRTWVSSGLLDNTWWFQRLEICESMKNHLHQTSKWERKWYALQI